MRIALKLIALVLAVSVTLYAQGNNWDRVRYNGGTLQTKVDAKDWGNHLTITSDLITFHLKDRQTLNIEPKSVTGLSYGQEAHRMVGTMVALGIIVSPVALFGLMHKTRQHFIGIEYKTPEGKGAGLLLQGHKENYRAILTSLEAVTGAPLAVTDKDREFVPAYSNTHIVTESQTKTASGKASGKGSGAAAGNGAGTGTAAAGSGAGVETGAATNAQSDSAAAPELTGSIAVTTSPDAADIYVDGAFRGNSPSTLKLPAGKHAIKVSQAGYQDWTREIDVSAGSDVKLNATLAK